MDLDNTKRFVVVKFINEDDDCDEEDDTVFEVALTKWLEGKLDNKMITKISWPPKSEQSIALKKELNARPSWPVYNVIVLKLYDTLLNARNGYILSSNYETENEFGRGKRKKVKHYFSDEDSFSTIKTNNKRMKNISFSDDSDFGEEDSTKQQFGCKRSAPSPPLISFQSQNNEIEKETDYSKMKRIEILQKDNKSEKRNDKKLTSQNMKCKNDLLRKIHQAKRKTSVIDNKFKIIETARQEQKSLKKGNRKLLSKKSTVKENIDLNILQQDFSKVQDTENVSSADNTSEKTSERSISINTPSTSKDNCIYKHSTFSDTSIHNKSVAESREMNPITAHVTAFTSTPCSSRSDSLSSSVSEVFDTKKKISSEKMYILNQEISSKLDMVIMNQCRLNRYLLPHEERIVRPANLPALPLITQEELQF